jgi:hypothetical protein
MKEVSGHHATVHLVTKDMFEQDLFSTEPCAIKRIILYRELLTIQGSEYIRDLKKKAKEFETELDKTFQKELLFKEEYLHLFSKNDITSFRFEYTDYKSLFPNIYKFITKEFHAGFPKGRTKLVYPQSMQLKLKFDIGRERAEEIL